MQALATLSQVGRPVTATVVVDDLPQGVNAYATTYITVSRQWLDEMIVSPEVLSGVLSHEQWHIDYGPHTCADNRRDRRSVPGAWQYHAETLRLLGAMEIAEIVATAPANYCD